MRGVAEERSRRINDPLVINKHQLPIRIYLFIYYFISSPFPASKIRIAIDLARVRTESRTQYVLFLLRPRYTAVACRPCCSPNPIFSPFSLVFVPHFPRLVRRPLYLCLRQPRGFSVALSALLGFCRVSPQSLRPALSSQAGPPSPGVCFPLPCAA